MQAPKYFPSQGSFFIRPNSRALEANLFLIFWHRPHYFECYQSYTPYYCQPQIPVAYHSRVLSLWYFVLVVIHERRYESLISWTIQACKLVYLLDVTLE